MLQPTPDFKVDRKRTRAKRPVTFLTAPAGVRRLQLRYGASRGEAVHVQVDVNVYPGQWRQLTIEERGYPPPVYDERGVNVNTVTRPGCWPGILWMLGFVVVGLLGIFGAMGGFALLAAYLRDLL